MNSATAGHAAAADGSWASPAALAAHLALLLTLPNRQRTVCRSRVALPGQSPSPQLPAPGPTPWRFVFRRPHGTWLEARGCALQGPLDGVDLHHRDGGLVADETQLAALREWVDGLHVSCAAAVVCGFPEATPTGVRVPLRLWLPRLWLERDASAVAGVQVVLDNALPPAQLCAEVERLLAPPASPRPVDDDGAGAADIAAALHRLADPHAPLRKVVLAWPQPTGVRKDFDEVLSCAARARPAAWLVAADLPGMHFVCTSPELLLLATADALETLALAGTLRGDEEVDARLQAEHGHVRDYLLGVLQHLGALPEAAPLELREAGPLRHLATAVRAGRPAGLDALTTALHLHPTPALLGTPRAEALTAIAALESCRRTWYGGFAGVLSATGDGCGELAVLLRGAEQGPTGWRTWAGAGLVAASQEADERDEVARKHQATASGLGLAGPA